MGIGKTLFQFALTFKNDAWGMEKSHMHYQVAEIAVENLEKDSKFGTLKDKIHLIEGDFVKSPSFPDASIILINGMILHPKELSKVLNVVLENAQPNLRVISIGKPLEFGEGIVSKKKRNVFLLLKEIS